MVLHKALYSILSFVRRRWCCVL